MRINFYAKIRRPTPSFQTVAKRGATHTHTHAQAHTRHISTLIVFGTDASLNKTTHKTGRDMLAVGGNYKSFETERENQRFTRDRLSTLKLKDRGAGIIVADRWSAQERSTRHFASGAPSECKDSASISSISKQLLQTAKDESKCETQIYCK